jgi:hypothetical protein
MQLSFSGRQGDPFNLKSPQMLALALQHGFFGGAAPSIISCSQDASSVDVEDALVLAEHIEI